MFQTLKLIRIKHVQLAIAASLIIVSASVTTMVLFSSGKVGPVVRLQYNSANQAINEPLVINLNRKIRDADLKSASITPKIAGKWEIKRGDLINSDQLVFRPKGDFQVNTKYKISTIIVERLVFGSVKLPEITVQTEPAPGLKNEGLIAIPTDSEIAADSTFSLSARYPIDLEIKTNPSIKLVRKIISDTDYVWLTDGLLPQGQIITVDIFNAKNDKLIATKAVKVAAEPKITFNKPTYFNQGDTAQILFSEDIKSPSSDSITFDVAGAGGWKSPKEYNFTPSKVEPGHTYAYTVKGGLRTKNGGILTQDYKGSFATTGPVSVAESTPWGQELSQASQLVSFTFDQSVDKESVSQRFSISSGSVVSTYWQGNVFFAKVSDLGYQRTVTATVASGVKNIGFGLPSAQSFAVSFTTEAKVIKYDVPFYRQQHSASCAAASLRMILAFRGVSASDIDIVQRMGYSPRPMDKSTDPPVWDDPNQMFVGDINGSLSNGTAAGPDAAPVVKAAQSYGRNASFATGISVNWIASQLSSGRLVVMFGAHKSTNNFVTWTTPSGGTARMNTSSHARAVIGVKGDPSSPIGFWINDPYLSGTQFWTASQLQANINLDAYQQAVSVE